MVALIIFAVVATECVVFGKEDVTNKDAAVFCIADKEIHVDYSDIEEEFLSDFWECDEECRREDNHPQCSLYDASDLTAEILESRNGSYIIERCIGFVTDSKEGRGKLLNFHDGGDYISYAGVNGIRDGSVVLSYMVYNPDNNSIDDISERYDFIISKEYED